MAAPVSHAPPGNGGCLIETFPTADLLAARAAALFFVAARQALAARGRFTVALSGGTSPLPLFRRLGEEAPHTGIDWGAVHVFWADERCVPPDHGESNFRQANELFLSRLPGPGPVIHRIAGELLPQVAAERYAAELSSIFGSVRRPDFDLILLGVGSDGHTASLFPGMNWAAHAGQSTMAVFVEKLRSHRITLTLPVLNAARQVLFLVTGADKAAIVAAILQGPGGTNCPAALVRPHDGTVAWLLDGEAAGRLVSLKIQKTGEVFEP
jgi:6-phosphogluconolactonase